MYCRGPRLMTMDREDLLRMLQRVLVWLIGAMGIVGLYLVSSSPAHAQIPDAARAHKREYTRIVRSEWGIDAPVASLAGQLAQESGFRDGLTSRTGARGIAQFMPTTAVWITEMRPDLEADALYSRAWSMRAQVAFMKWLLVRVRGDNECEAWGFALQAYNGGLGRVYQRQKLSRRAGQCFGVTCDINPGIHPANQKEAREYPARVEFVWAARFVNAGWGRASCKSV